MWLCYAMAPSGGLEDNSPCIWAAVQLPSSFAEASYLGYRLPRRFRSHVSWFCGLAECATGPWERPQSSARRGLEARNKSSELGELSVHEVSNLHGCKGTRLSFQRPGWSARRRRGYIQADSRQKQKKCGLDESMRECSPAVKCPVASIRRVVRLKQANNRQQGKYTASQDMMVKESKRQRNAKKEKNGKRKKNSQKRLGDRTGGQ
jgi:hypothetical protein